MPRRLRLFLFSLVVAVVAAEALLQLGYFVMWASRPTPTHPTAGAGDARTILCVGDSFTYGMHASSPQHSYPAQLEERLRRDTSVEWHVENRGWPGRMSREVLEQLDGWLAQTKPRFLCIAVGVNDSWRRPEELVLPDDGSPAAPVGSGEPYVWTFRLGRLFTAFRTHGPFRDQQATPPAETVAPPTPAALVGDWVLLGPGAMVTLRADGTGSVGPEPLQWQLEGARLTITAKVLPPIAGACRIDGDEMTLAVEGAQPLVLMRPAKAAAAGNAAAEAYRAMSRGDHAAAEAAFREAIATDSPGNPWGVGLHAGLASALVARGKRDEALAELATVRKVHEEQHDLRSYEALASALMMLGFEKEAADVIAEVLPSDPESPTIWSLQADVAAKRGDKAAARTAIDKSIDLATKAGWDRSHLYVCKAHLHSDSAAHAPIYADCTVAAHQECADDRRIRQLLSLWRAPAEAKEPALRAACEARKLTAEHRDVLLRLFREASGEGDEQWKRILKGHLRQMIRRARRAGCEPILATYPFQSDLRWIMKALAADEHCTFVEIDTVFAGIREKEPTRALYVTDGHCNDDGYGVMAACIAEAIRALPLALR